MPQHSPIIHWLLVAATICVDLVAISWAYSTTLNRTEEFYFGLACSQISLVCVWAFFSEMPGIWKWPAPFLAATAAAALTTALYSLEDRVKPPRYEIGMTYLSLWMAQVGILIVGLCTIQQTSLARSFGRHGVAGQWRFGIRHVLAVTTILAILLAVLRQAQFVHQIWIAFAVWVCNNAAVGLAVVAVQAMPWHAVLRLAAIAGAVNSFAIVLGLMHIGGEPLAINLIQGIVLFLWLEFGQILPTSAPAPRDPVQGDAA